MGLVADQIAASAAVDDQMVRLRRRVRRGGL
jgi:hypothetical protein